MVHSYTESLLFLLQKNCLNAENVPKRPTFSCVAHQSVRVRSVQACRYNRRISIVKRAPIQTFVPAAAYGTPQQPLLQGPQSGDVHRHLNDQKHHQGPRSMLIVCNVIEKMMSFTKRQRCSPTHYFTPREERPLLPLSLPPESELFLVFPPPEQQGDSGIGVGQASSFG